MRSRSSCRFPDRDRRREAYPWRPRGGGQLTLFRDEVAAASSIEMRRRALRRVAELQDRIAALRREAAKASQMAKQVEINLQLRKLEGEHVQEVGRL